MSALIERLRANRAERWDAASQLANIAAEENRAFTGDEQRTWDQLNSELDEFDARIKALLDGETRARESADAQAGAHGPRRTRRSANDSELEAAFRHAIARRDPSPIECGLESRTWNPAQEEIETRALLTTEGGAGNPMVPKTFLDQVVHYWLDESGIMAAGARMISSPNGGELTIPRLQTNASAVTVPEAQVIPYSQPAYLPVKLNAYKFGWLTQASHEALEDTGFDLLGELAQQNGVALGQATGPFFVSGASGSGPTGLLTGLAAAAITGASGASGAPTADQLIDLMFMLPDGYANDPTCCWLMHRSTLAQVRKLKASGTGEYLFTPDRVPGSRAKGSIFGYPVFTDPWMPTGAAKRSIVFGPMDYFYVRQVGGFRWERSDEFAFDRDLATFRGLLRLDSVLVDNRAFVSFQGGA